MTFGSTAWLRWPGRVRRAEVLQHDVRRARFVEDSAGVRRDDLVVLAHDARVRRAGDVHAAAGEVVQERRRREVLLARAARRPQDRAEPGHGGEQRLGQRVEAAERGAAVVRAEADEVGDLRRAAAVLQVVRGHRAALGVADDVDLRRTGRGPHPVDEPAELRGAVAHGREPADAGAEDAGAVGQREDAVALGGDLRRVEEPVDGVVRAEAVHEHDGLRVRGRRTAAPVVPAAARRRFRDRRRDRAEGERRGEHGQDSLDTAVGDPHSIASSYPSVRDADHDLSQTAGDDLGKRSELPGVRCDG